MSICALKTFAAVFESSISIRKEYFNAAFETGISIRKQYLNAAFVKQYFSLLVDRYFRSGNGPSH